MSQNGAKQFDMDYQQKLTLSPLQKYELYNIFPWQMILHTFLIIFTTIQVLSVLEQLTAQNRAQHMILKHVLLGMDDDSDVTKIYSLDDFQAKLQTMIESLQDLDGILFQRVDMEQAEFNFNVFYTIFDPENANQTIFDVDISQQILEPFNISDSDSIKEFIEDVQMLEFEGSNINHQIKFMDLSEDESCISWKFKVTYNFEKIGVIQQKIETSNSNCSENHSKQSGQDFLLIHFIVLILGAVSVYTTIKYLYDIGAEYLSNKKMYKEVKNAVEQQPLNDFQQDVIQQSPSLGVKFSQVWKQLDYKEDVKQFDNWQILNAIGGFFQIVGATIAILDQTLTNDLSIYKFQISMMGFGCFLSWLMLLQYLEFFQDISIVTWTLRKSSKNMVMFIFSILPFFLGFVYLAQALFWKYNYFETTMDTVLSLFALSNGDILLESFNLVKPIGVVGQIFLIIFMIVFFTAVQSVLIAIIMEGYDIINAQRKEQQKQDDLISDEILDQLQKEQEEISKQAQKDSEDDDDKEIVIKKLNLMMRRVDRMLEDLDLMTKEIEEANITSKEKEYLLNVLGENIDNLSRHVKFQISNMES